MRYVSHPGKRFTNNELSRPIGMEGSSLRRNTPTVINVAYLKNIFHDGRGTTRETQIGSPSLTKNELGNPPAGWIVRKITSLPDYRAPFARAFQGEPSLERITHAITAWERIMLSGNTAFDRFFFNQRAGRTFNPTTGGGYPLHRAGGMHSLSPDRGTIYVVHRPCIPRYRPGLPGRCGRNPRPITGCCGNRPGALPSDGSRSCRKCGRRHRARPGSILNHQCS